MHARLSALLEEAAQGGSHLLLAGAPECVVERCAGVAAGAVGAVGVAAWRDVGGAEAEAAPSLGVLVEGVDRPGNARARSGQDVFSSARRVDVDISVARAPVNLDDGNAQSSGKLELVEVGIREDAAGLELLVVLHVVVPLSSDEAVEDLPGCEGIDVGVEP